jgi:acylglycerol lipase
MPVDFKETQRQSVVPSQSLHAVSYLPSRPTPPIAVLCFHHGLAENIARYHAAFTHFAEKGIAVYSQDALGHGRSTGDRAYIKQFDLLLQDFTSLCMWAREDIAAQYPEFNYNNGNNNNNMPPFFLGGHSLGGLVAALTAVNLEQKKEEDTITTTTAITATAATTGTPPPPLLPSTAFQGLLLSSAALDVEWTPILRVQAMLGGLLSSLFPTARIVPAVRPEDMSDDAASVEAYKTDPLNTIGPLPARTANETLRAFKSLQSRADQLTMPIYAHHGDCDKCTSRAAVQRFVEMAGSEDKMFKTVNGGYHELMMGPRSGDVLDGMVEWMVLRSGGGGVGGGGSRL